MRIVAVADTHLYEHDLGVLPAGDILVHAGDMLRHGGLDELQVFVEWLHSQPHSTKIVVAGNHDWCLQRERVEAETLLGPEVHYLEDSGATIHGLRWWGSPWQPEYRQWAFNLPRGRPLSEKWALIPDSVDILVTHAPPAGLGDRSPIDGRTGCEDLRRRVEELGPRLHIFGHIHQGGGLWQIGKTTSVNVTTWECDRGATVIDVAPKTGVVQPVEVPPAGD